jgi:hypothetical protein
MSTTPITEENPLVAAERNRCLKLAEAIAAGAYGSQGPSWLAAQLIVEEIKNPAIHIDERSERPEIERLTERNRKEFQSLLAHLSDITIERERCLKIVNAAEALIVSSGEGILPFADFAARVVADCGIKIRSGE